MSLNSTVRKTAENYCLRASRSFCQSRA